MFRYDRTFINISPERYVLEIKKPPNAADDDANAHEADAEGELPDSQQASKGALEAAASPANSASHDANNAGSAAAREQAKEIIEKAHAEAREILSKAQAEATTEAQRIISEARDQAGDVLLDAREEAAEEHRKAMEKGFAEGSAAGLEKGIEEGIEKGKEEGRREYDEKILDDDKKLLSVLDDINDEMERTDAELQGSVADLALDIVRKILDPSDTENGVFELLIKNALKQIRTDRKIIIRVGQDEYKRFFPSGSAVFDLPSGVKVKATVLEDQSLGAGDVVIDAEEETINAGLESQLKYIELAFDRADVS